MKKQITVMGTVWDFWPVLKCYDDLYDSKYISFYEPWIKDEIESKKIIKLNEYSKNKFLWPYKLIRRNYYLSKNILNFKPDYVISHHDDASISIFPTLLLFKLFRSKIKFISYIHAGKNTYDKSNFFLNISKFFIKYMYRFYDKVITVSEGNKKALKDYFNLKNLQVVYNPVDINKIKMLSEQKEDLIKEEGDIIILTIGRLTEQKGYWYLIRVFAQIVKNNKNVKLYLIGDGEQREELENFVLKLNLEKNVFFLGNKSNVFPYIKQSDIFVLTSLWESFGQVIVEALALNKIVISTDCNFGPREILDIGNFKNKINKYPSYSKYGILIKPFERKYLFKSVAEVKLLDEEKILFEVLTKIIKNPKKFKEKYFEGIKRAEDFDVNQIKKKVKLVLEK